MFPNLRVFRTDLHFVYIQVLDPHLLPFIRLQLIKFRDTILLNLPLSLQRLEIFLASGRCVGVTDEEAWKLVSESLRRFPKLKRLSIHLDDGMNAENDPDGEAVCATYFPELHAKGVLHVDVGSWLHAWWVTV